MKLRLIWKKLFERSAVVTAVLLLLAQVVVYAATKPIVASLPKVDMSLGIDARIPYVPFFFVPYFLCFGYWGVLYAYIAGLGARRRANLAATALCSSVLIGALFVLIPTEIARPTDLGGGFYGFLASLAYEADTPLNLFPSFHCFASWLCFVGVRGAKEVKPWLKLTALLAALVTFASTVLVKQHYIVDFIPSVLIAEFFWLLSRKTGLYRPFERFLRRIFTLLKWEA